MGRDLLVLGLETSCDETSAAVLRGTSQLLGHVIVSQDAHRVWGGVVPEIAARAHLRVTDQAVAAALAEAGVGLADVDLIGVTAGPGLIGALLVGVAWALWHLALYGIADGQERTPLAIFLVSVVALSLVYT